MRVSPSCCNIPSFPTFPATPSSCTAFSTIRLSPLPPLYLADPAEDFPDMKGRGGCCWIVTERTDKLFWSPLNEGGFPLIKARGGVKRQEYKLLHCRGRLTHPRAEDDEDEAFHSPSSVTERCLVMLRLDTAHQCILGVAGAQAAKASSLR